MLKFSHSFLYGKIFLETKKKVLFLRKRLIFIYISILAERRKRNNICYTLFYGLSNM